MTKIIPNAPTSDDQIEFEFNFAHGSTCPMATTKSTSGTHFYFDVEPGVEPGTGTPVEPGTGTR